MLAALLALFPCQVLAQKLTDSLWGVGRLTFYGSVGVEAEDYQYTSGYETRDRMRLRTRFDLNGRGFVWDPRFAVFDAGITLQRDNVRTDESDTRGGDTSQNMIGYRLNTTWFANKPYPLTVYASRSQNLVSDYWTPSYQLTTNNFGARWGLENNWLGRASLFLDRTSSESDNTLVPRSDRNLSFGLDANQKLRRKQWGESDLTYGYRHTAWDQEINDSQQRQDYFYLNDRSILGDKANLTANMTYFNRSDQWGYWGSGREMASNFLGLNTMLNVQQNEKFRHYYGLGMGFNDFGGVQSSSQNVTGGANYRLNEQWQINAMLGLSASKTESTLDGVALTQDGSTTTGSAGVTYSDRWGNYLLTGGYTLTMMRSDTTAQVGGLPGQQNSTHTANFGYSRMNSPLYGDSLQLRLSQTLGEPSGSELNVRYSVTSLVSQNDMLQGAAEYRRYQQEYAVWSGTVLVPDDYYYYDLDSRSTRLDLGWLHRFSEASSLMLTAGASNGESQGYVVGTRYAQARATMRLRSVLHGSLMARAEKNEGSEYFAGQQTLLESDLNYRIGKWQASARLRYRDAKLEINPFKERSIMFILRRDFAFRR